MCYYVKATALWFASFEADTEAVTWFSGERRHRSRAFGKTNQAPIQRFNVSFIWYKLRSSVANLATLSLDLATFQTPLATFF